MHDMTYRITCINNHMSRSDDMSMFSHCRGSSATKCTRAACLPPYMRPCVDQVLPQEIVNLACVCRCGLCNFLRMSWCKRKRPCSILICSSEAITESMSIKLRELRAHITTHAKALRLGVVSQSFPSACDKNLQHSDNARPKFLSGT